MSVKKNDLFTVKIEDLSAEGAGIGKVAGFPLFIKDALIGDVVEAKVMKAKKNYAFARLMKIIEPSPDRAEPRCPVARQCGGCQLQALSYEKQLAFKENKVRNNLLRIGGLTEGKDYRMLPIVGMDEPFHYRNKAQFPVGTDKDGNVVTGFYAGRTHSIIPNTKCCLGVDVNEVVLEKVLAYMKECRVPAYDEEKGSGLVRHVLIRYGFATGEVMVCLVVNGRELPGEERLVRSLREIEGMTSISLNVNRERTNVILGQELRVLWGEKYITDRIGEVKYRISPLSFYQVNPVQTEKLYKAALEFAGLRGDEVVWDLYCGIGTISLFLAQKAKMVYGVEIVPDAVEDARENARINGIENVEFFVGKAEEVLPKMYEDGMKRADVVVVDPPRKGCDQTLLETVVRMGPGRVVYVSCDSATLARDLKWFGENGYVCERVGCVDMFPGTVHVETACLLVRKP